MRPPKLDIGMVTPGYPPDLGGVETVVARLAEAMAGKGHQVSVLSHRRRGSSTDANKGSVSVERFADWTGSRRFEIAPGLWRHLRTFGAAYDVLHAHSFHASAALAASSMTNRPLVFTPHYHGVGHTRAARAMHVAYDPLAASVFDRAATVICVSEAEAAMLVRDYPRTAEKICVIPNGIDVREIRAAEPFPIDRPVLLSAGRLETYKQVDLAIRAMQYVCQDALLVVTGRGPALDSLRALATELHVDGRVRFAGFVDTHELRRWQRTATIALTLSRHEAFGLALLEAAVAGCHVVASDIPAHRELALSTQSLTTLVATNIRPVDLAAQIDSLLTDSSADAGISGVATWDDVATATEDVLRVAAGCAA